MALIIEPYVGNEREWDRFMLEDSMNGTFLQTRRFIGYHPEGRFRDASLCIRRGQELAAAILGCETEEEEDGKVFHAHRGTTFGGLTVRRSAYSASAMEEIMTLLEGWWKEQGYARVDLKLVPRVYQRENADLLDYFFYKFGYTGFSELNYYLPLERYREDVISRFSSGKRRDYRYALKQGLTFSPLHTREEIADYYRVLLKNLKKLNLTAVHSLEDLYDLAFERFPDRVAFYGVFLEDRMIAGSMMFRFSSRVIHTQYLSSDEDYLHCFPMDFLIENLIQTAVDEGMEIFTFGICTEDRGRYLNMGLSRFKEGFGTEYCINRSYEKKL